MDDECWNKFTSFEGAVLVMGGIFASTKREMAWSFLLAKKYESQNFFLKQYDFAKCVFDACLHTIKPQDK